MEMNMLGGRDCLGIIGGACRGNICDITNRTCTSKRRRISGVLLCRPASRMNLARERNQHPAALRLRGTSNGDGVLQVQCTILSDAIWSTLRTSDDHWLLAGMNQIKKIRSFFQSIGAMR